MIKKLLIFLLLLSTTCYAGEVGVTFVAPVAQYEDYTQYSSCEFALLLSEEASPTQDASSKNRDGTIDGAVYSSSSPTGYSGGSYYFDGSNDKITVADVDSVFDVTTSDSYTITCWTYVISNPSAWSGIVNRGRDSGSWYGIWINTSNQYIYANEPINTVCSSITTGDWVHLAIIQTGSSNRKLYIDGVEDNSATVGSSNGTGDFWIFGADGQNEFLNGYATEVAYFSEALTTDDLASIISHGLKGDRA